VDYIKKNYLYFNNTKIKLYFNKNIKKPKQNTKIEILSGILTIFNSKIQITITKQSDFKVLYR